MKKLLVLSSVVLFTSFANAGMLLEPYLGYQMGKIDYSGGVEGDTKGTGLGLRVGYQMVIPWIALDVQLGKGKVSKVNPESDYSYTDVGVTAGASVPFLRPFVGYIPAAKHKFEPDTGSSYNLEGNGLKLGLGIKLLPFIDINIEQVTYTYKKIDGLDLSSDVKMKNTIVGIGMTF